MGSELSNEGQGNDYLGLIVDEVAKIKAILVDRISRVESCVKEGGVSAARGSQQVQEIQEMEERDVEKTVWIEWLSTVDSRKRLSQ